ncbi:hypothetical protein AAGS61_17780 [Lysinibacillus sp. KU-BSD001]|uniref:hypothetical protein n=1 Tax=Lysinibacillus sp. KU-BSD001 TaxID=3141328 RepID=UPI0036E3FE31
MSRSTPLAMFVTKNDELVGVYPGILGGNTLVIAKNVADSVLEITHQCQCCRFYREECPIIQSIIWYMAVHHKKRITGFNWVQEKVTLQLDWHQIPIPSLDMKPVSREDFV